MTILYNQTIYEFDPDPKFAEYDRAQPLAVDPSDTFVFLTQWDGAGGRQHCILVERRDVQALIEALQRSEDYEYRVKPSAKKYRVALFCDGTEGYTSTADNQETSNDYEGMHHFARWLTDWVEYKEK